MAQSHFILTKVTKKFHVVAEENIHHCLQNIPPLDSILRHFNPVHILVPYFSNTPFFPNIIPTTLHIRTWFYFKFSNKNFIYFVSSERWDRATT